MVKARQKAVATRRLFWWRAFLGALVTGLIIVPYKMGSDAEQYMQQWVKALNQSTSSFHLELKDYKRHWLTSEAELSVTGGPLKEPLLIPFKSYHGPLFFNAGSLVRVGLTVFKAKIDGNQLLKQPSALHFEGPIQLTAFVPYFKEREIHGDLPTLSVAGSKDKIKALHTEGLSSLLDSLDYLINKNTAKTARRQV